MCATLVVLFSELLLEEMEPGHQHVHYVDIEIVNFLVRLLRALLHLQISYDRWVESSQLQIVRFLIFLVFFVVLGPLLQIQLFYELVHKVLFAHFLCAQNVVSLQNQKALPHLVLV